jgi:hypothetical protein
MWRAEPAGRLASSAAASAGRAGACRRDAAGRRSASDERLRGAALEGPAQRSGAAGSARESRRPDMCGPARKCGGGEGGGGGSEARLEPRPYRTFRTTRARDGDAGRRLHSGLSALPRSASLRHGHTKQAGIDINISDLVSKARGTIRRHRLDLVVVHDQWLRPAMATREHQRGQACSTLLTAHVAAEEGGTVS